MGEDRNITIYFHRHDGPSEQIPLLRGTIAEAVAAIERVFYITNSLYTSADIYRRDELVESVENPACVRVESILVH
jgi:hypothetical protein